MLNSSVEFALVLFGLGIFHVAASVFMWRAGMKGLAIVPLMLSIALIVVTVFGALYGINPNGWPAWFSAMYYLNDFESPLLLIVIVAMARKLGAEKSKRAT